MELEPWIETYSGIKFNFLDPKPEMVDIVDIAHALSLQPRFSGHLRQHYSVAEHSLHVCSFTNSLEGLLHDASEAYLVDIPSPIKAYLPGYKVLEERVSEVIFKKFGLTYPYSSDVKFFDEVMVVMEADLLLPSRGRDWIEKYAEAYAFYSRPGNVVPCFEQFLEYSHKEVRETFVCRFYELMEVRNTSPTSLKGEQ